MPKDVYRFWLYKAVYSSALSGWRFFGCAWFRGQSVRSSDSDSQISAENGSPLVLVNSFLCRYSSWTVIPPQLAIILSSMVVGHVGSTNMIRVVTADISVWGEARTLTPVRLNVHRGRAWVCDFIFYYYFGRVFKGEVLSVYAWVFFYSGPVFPPDLLPP